MYGVGEYNFLCDGYGQCFGSYPDSMGSEDPDHKEAGKNVSQKRKMDDILMF
jgi:hypothetical protein